MRSRLQLALLFAAAAAGCASSALGQNAPASPAPCTVAPQPVPCSATPPAKPSDSTPDAAQRFPFPGEDVSGPKVPSVDSVKGASVPDAPGTTSPASKNPSGAAFPFPGEDASSSSSGDSSSSSSSSGADNPTPPDTDPDADSKPALKDKGSEGALPGRHLLKRVNPVGTKLQTDEEREAEDLDVAHFYSQSGDLPGAYLRTKDAVKIAPDDAEAHFALAEVARKMNKRDQAIEEYNACLRLDPAGDKASAAHKALARLTKPQ